MTDANRLFSRGSPNPAHFDLFAIRKSVGHVADPELIETAARKLGREAFYTDANGYEREILAAVISPAGQLAYVESCAKDVGPHPHGFRGRQIDVSIRVHQVDAGGTEMSAEIESYNPFFGCIVRFFDWIGDSVVLIYREKHETFACRFGDLWPPLFIRIEDDWLIHEEQLAYIGYREDSVQRLSLPDLNVLDPLTVERASELGLLPRTEWT